LIGQSASSTREVVIAQGPVDPIFDFFGPTLTAALRARVSPSGSKTRPGARIFEVLASLAATCRQRGEDFLQLAAASARFQPA
jgi:hypothetical protein